MPFKEEEENKNWYLSWWTHRVERASPRSRLKRAWWKEAEEFEVILLTSVFLCSVLVLLDLLLCCDGPVVTTTKAFGFRENFTPWELGLGKASHMRKRECECLGVWFQMLSFGVWVWAGAAMTMDWRRGRDGSCAGEREREKLDFLFGYSDFYQKQWAGCEFFEG